MAKALLYFGAVTSLASVLAVEPAYGQVADTTRPEGTQPVQPQTDDSGIGDIIVTAQKRSEKLQDVPIAISAFTSTALSERAVTSVAALSNLAPSVTLDAAAPFSGSSQVLGATIRGIGQQDFAMNVDPGVGVYLDGVYLARTVGANLDLPDVERVEILKGPQGTLFGRNTIGGAISITTKDPTDEFGFDGEVITGSYKRFDVRGTVNVPVADHLNALLTFSEKSREGYQRSIPYPSASPINSDPVTAFRQVGYDTHSRSGGEGEYTIRGKLLWEPTSRLQVRLSGDYTKVDTTATANSLLGVSLVPPPGPAGTPATPPLAAIYNLCISTPAAALASAGLGAVCGSRGTPLDPSRILPGLAGLNADGDPSNDRLPFDDRFVTSDIDTTYATAQNFSRMKSWGLTSLISYDLTDNISLKSITGYRDLDWGTGLDGDGSPVQMLELGFSLKQWQFSQETQIIGNLLDHKLNFVVGGYYFKEKGFTNDYVTFGDGLLQIQGPNNLKTENYAFFGQADWRITDFIGITVGGRYTHEAKDFIGGQTDNNGLYYKLANCTTYGDPCSTAIGIPDPSQPLRFYTPVPQHRTFTNFSPKVGVQLHPTDDIMVYGSWSRGYKTGGWSTRLTAPGGAVAPDFRPEKAETFEAGFKSTLLDRALQFNLAAFTTRYEDIQLNLQVGIAPTIRNAGVARIKGLEAEFVVKPAHGLLINASASYIDATYTSVRPDFVLAPNALQAGIYPGAALPKTPKWKVNLSPSYKFDLANGGSLTFLADYTRTSSVWNDTERTYLLRRPSTDMLNLSATYRAPSGKWDLSVGGTNVTDDRYVVTGLAQLSIGPIYGTYNAPAEWYAKLGFHF